MSRYAPLISLQIEHEFFEDSRCEALSCDPDAVSLKVVADCELALKTGTDGATVYFDQERTEALKLATAQSAALPELWFRLDARDPQFSNWTSPSIPRQEAVLFFTNADEQPATDPDRGRVSLARTDTVSDADFLALDAEPLSEVLTARDRRSPPVAFVRLVLQDLAPRHYVLRFEARQTYWKYYLLGDLARPSATIADTRLEMEFESGKETRLADNRRAVSFTSKTKIALRQHSDRHFQLRENGSDFDRVLIKHLPAASADRLYKDTINGQEALVSDIYINC